MNMEVDGDDVVVSGPRLSGDGRSRKRGERGLLCNMQDRECDREDIKQGEIARGGERESGE